MKCEKCKKREAVIRFTQISKNGEHRFNLCQHCAENHGLENPIMDLSKLFGKLIINILSDLIKTQEKEEELVASPGADIVCSQCGLTFHEFNETGRLGCADCYHTYYDELKIILRRLHGNNHHVHFKNDQTQKEDIKSTVLLKNKLKEAIQVEDYEHAAELRDQISAIEHKIES